LIIVEHLIGYIVHFVKNIAKLSIFDAIRRLKS